MADYSTSPLLINDNGKQYRIMNVSTNKDGSFYFSFPNETGYKITKFTKEYYSDADYSKKIIEQKPADIIYEMPKISFHPRNFTMHIKSQSTNDLVNGDYELYNFNKDGSFECPLMQIVLPYELSFFETYNKTKYPIKCILDRKEFEKNMCIYVFIHGTDVAPPLVLPIKSKTPYNLGAVALVDNKYTFSYYINYIPKSDNKDILLAINTKKCGLFLTLEK